jgi:hypothetical protein
MAAALLSLSAAPAAPPDSLAPDAGAPSIDSSSPCAACGRPVGERAWVVTGRGGIFCDACRAASVPCSACGAPLRAMSLRDGRAFCPECAATLVHASGDVEAIYRDLLAAARARLGLEIERPPRLVLDSELALRDRPAHPAPEGLCGLYVREGGEDPAIHVLVPLPRARLTAVLAHEIAHAWQAEACPDEQGTRLREGFAEWVSWRLLEGREGCAGERRVIEARSDAYGDGFRVFAGLEARGGASAPVWYARAARASR